MCDLENLRKTSNEAVCQGFAKSCAERLVVTGGVALYVYLYNWLYVAWLSPEMSYFNFTYTKPPDNYFLFAWVLALIPCLWMPLALRRPSYMTHWVIYLIIYIPSTFGPLYMRLRPLSEIRDLMVTMFFAMVILAMPMFVPLPKIGLRPIPRSMFWFVIGSVIILFDLYVFLSFRGQLKIVSFEDVYSVRAAAKSVTGSGPVIYAMMPLLTVLDPLLMAAGMAGRRIWLFSAGAAGQLLIYAAVGLKSVLLSVPATILAFIIAKYFSRRLALCLVGGTVALFAALFTLVATSANHLSLLADAVLFFVLGRVFGMTGMLSGQYHDFFMNHPLTHFTHAKPFVWFGTYPYRLPIGQEIGAFWGKGEFGSLNENTHFWMSDGMSSLGLPGILVISVLAALVLWLLDSALEHHRITFSCAFLVFISFQLTTLPLLTMLGSGGVGVIIFVLYWMSDDAVPQDKGWFYRLSPHSLSR